MNRTTSAVVLSYERPAMLRASLESLQAQSPPLDEMIVVNNPGPRSPEIDDVLASFPSCRMIRPSENLGFTGGMNLGLRAASGHWVYFTEDDMITRPGCLSALRECMERHPDTGLAAPVMFRRGTHEIHSAGCRLHLGSVFRQEGLGRETWQTAVAQGTVEIDFAGGSALFAERQRILDCGGFHPDFFMYYEDAELALRLKRFGFKVRLSGHAAVEHFDPPPSAFDPGLEFHKMKNLVALYALHGQPHVWPIFFLRYALIQPLRIFREHPRRARTMWRAWARQLSRLPASFALERESWPPLPHRAS